MDSWCAYVSQNDSGITLCVCKNYNNAKVSATFWSNESHNTRTQTHTGVCGFQAALRWLDYGTFVLFTALMWQMLCVHLGELLTQYALQSHPLYTHQIFIVEIQPLESASCHYILSIVYLYVTSCNTPRHIWLRTTIMMSWCTFSCMDEQRKKRNNWIPGGWMKNQTQCYLSKRWWWWNFQSQSVLFQMNF